MTGRSGEAVEAQLQHADAGDRQQDHRTPDPDEEAAEHVQPQLQPRRRLQRRDRRGAQDHPREEHAADPDQGGQHVQGVNEGEGCH
ncbi:hypothetical protein FQZ97_1168380 [compost metagenome]